MHQMPAEELGRPQTDAQRLPSFIARNIEPIVCEWEAFARTLTPSSDGMTSLALRDHIHQILQFVSSDMVSEQTPREETVKSRGKKKEARRKQQLKHMLPYGLLEASTLVK